jgi:stage II sporulation protein D
VAARTYALHKRDQVSNPLYDLDTTTNTQVYRGLETEYHSTHAAVDATAGQIMTYNGKIILAVFHAASGGHTENAGDIWSSSLPYLQGVVDYDQGTPVYQWRKSFSSNELADLIEGVGTVKEMIPERTTPRGRVVTMKVVGDLGTQRISGADLRKMLGLRSTLFEVQANGSYFQLSGRGFGHGVGMSQWGAYNLARQGQDYRRILAHYYRNTVISQIE